jgi:3-hydroxyisobutyrate dehydrogenase-like beta-hydroxyacid dehydrogenase
VTLSFENRILFAQPLIDVPKLKHGCTRNTTLVRFKLRKGAIMQIGILHPGAMGISVAVAAQNGGHTLHWLPQGRSQATRERAERHKLVGAESLEALCQQCALLMSICPPHAAEDVARQVVEGGVTGLYLDANAISPARAQRIEQVILAAGATFVDGSIIGPPAWEPGQTWLYLSGHQAEQVAACFKAGPLQTKILGADSSAASALKMCFAAYTKGTTALLCAIMATADSLGVADALAAQWRQGDSDFAEQTAARVRSVTAKAWRFQGEMKEIAATFEAAGLPAGFHLAAADIYRRLADFKDAPTTPQLAEVLAALKDDADDKSG